MAIPFLKPFYVLEQYTFALVSSINYFIQLQPNAWWFHSLNIRFTRQHNLLFSTRSVLRHSNLPLPVQTNVCLCCWWSSEYVSRPTEIWRQRVHFSNKNTHIHTHTHINTFFFKRRCCYLLAKNETGLIKTFKVNARTTGCHPIPEILMNWGNINLKTVWK